MNLAILTVHQAPNCGAMLQAWALKTVLEREGHNVEFPDCNHINYRGRELPFITPPDLRGARRLSRGVKNWLRNLSGREIFRRAMDGFDQFRLKNMRERVISPEEFLGKYDAVILGSDQIWNGRIMGEDLSIFLGERIPDEVKKLSYAASFGDCQPQGEELTRIINAVNRFTAIGVREESAMELLAGKTRIEPKLTIDPTLLLEAEDYRKVSTPSHPAEPYLYAYSLIYVEEFYQKVKAVAKQLGLKVIYTPLSQYTSYQMPKGITYGVSPDQFVDLIANANCVVTDSFHGTAVTLLHGKSLVSISHAKNRQHSRHGLVLSKLGCEERLCGLDVSVEKMAELLTTPMSDEVAKRLKALREDSSSWLKKAVEE